MKVCCCYAVRLISLAWTRVVLVLQGDKTSTRWDWPSSVQVRHEKCFLAPSTSLCVRVDVYTLHITRRYGSAQRHDYSYNMYNMLGVHGVFYIAYQSWVLVYRLMKRETKQQRGRWDTHAGPLTRTLSHAPSFFTYILASACLCV